MTNQHPITPPPELIKQWISAFYNTPVVPGEFSIDIATKAARWGAEMELEACCELLDELPYDGPMLYDARRPKPPGLKDRALAALNVIEDKMLGPTTEEKLIRLALEALPND